MIKITCDSCGSEMDPTKNSMGKIPTIKFEITTPNGKPREFHTKVLFGASALEYVCCFDTTGIHYCSKCITKAFANGVAELAKTL